jgi:hypothetical protein
VPWPAAVPAPGASNVVIVVLVSPAFTESFSPKVQRTRQSAIGRRGQTLDAQIDFKILVVLFERVFFIIRFVSQATDPQEAHNDQIALRRVTSYACLERRALRFAASENCAL